MTLTEFSDWRTVGLCSYCMGFDGAYYLTEIRDKNGAQIYVLDETGELASEMAEHPAFVEVVKNTLSN
ncbi:MAG: hypothetical protein PHX83_11955 [Acidobacteriia bacterium]|nr:hypothetical protein [Terriglobia bacterium]